MFAALYCSVGRRRCIGGGSGLRGEQRHLECSGLTGNVSRGDVDPDAGVPLGRKGDAVAAEDPVLLDGGAAHRLSEGR